MSVDSIGLYEPFLKAVKELGYRNLTPVQQQAFPVIMKGKDVLACAQTGTGKTAAFLLPIMQLLSKDKALTQSKCPKAIVLAPTRELVQQVHQNAQSLAHYAQLTSCAIYGGAGMAGQKAALTKAVDIVIATPGRLLEHLSVHNISLSQVKYWVLDEADRMLDMGFMADIEKLLAGFKRKPQIMMFSATFSNAVTKLATQILQTPITIETTKVNTTSGKVKQQVYRVSELRKRELLSELIGVNNWQQVLIFAGTKQSADALVKELKLDGIKAAVCHGDKSQGARNKALQAFKEGSIRALVATDVAARGLDIEALPIVVNFHLPFLAEDYVHRIGRTGRAGHSGLAISLVSPKDEKFMANIEAFIGRKFEKIVMPGYEFDPQAEPMIKELAGNSLYKARNRHQQQLEKNRKIADKNNEQKRYKKAKKQRKIVSSSKTKNRR